MKDCPNCDRPAIGSTAISLTTKGTETELLGVICAGCGIVYCPR